MSNRNSDQICESIKHINELGQEFWFTRELQEILEYTEWRNFANIIDKAKIACSNNGADINDHFVDVNKMVEIGSDAEREIDDIMLSRYVGYMIEASSIRNALRGRSQGPLDDKSVGRHYARKSPTSEKSIKQIEREVKKKYLTTCEATEDDE